MAANNNNAAKFKEDDSIELAVADLAKKYLAKNAAKDVSQDIVSRNA